MLFQLTRASKNDDTFFDAGAVQPMLSLLEAQQAMDDARHAGAASPSSFSSADDASKMQLPMEAPILAAR